MKRRLIQTLVILVLVAAAVVAALTFTTSGDRAIQKMTGEENAVLEKVGRLSRGMDYAEVEAILGKPDRAAGGNRPTWRVAGSGLNQIAAYFDSGGLRKVRWMKIGKFVYEPELQ